MKLFSSPLLYALVIFIACSISSIYAQGSNDYSGKVITSDGEPVSFAYLHLQEINRTTTADKDGEFVFQNVPDGKYTLSVHRIGFNSKRSEITISEDTRSDNTVELQATSISSSEILVEDTREAGRSGNLEHASTKIIGEDLRRNLGTTLSETLQNSPGFSERTSGPGPGRPVIRGLDGERVLILKDGVKSGDVSSISADHSVSIDPMSAEEIEIARGPAALVYGGNAVGGIVNVVKNHIPTSVPNRKTGTFSLMGKSVNNEGSAALQVKVPAKNFAAKLDLNGRIGDDFNTPDGPITNTYITNTDNTIGASYIKPWGYIGGFGSYLYSDYGIPPDPNGGHPEGVNIEMNKSQFGTKGEYIFDDSFFRFVEWELNYTRYNHKEFESNGSLGTEFSQISLNGSVKSPHKNWLFFDSGIIGARYEFTDYSVFGASTPTSEQVAGSVFVIQEKDIDALHLEAGIRFDGVHSVPDETRVSSIIGPIRSRTHNGLSASVSAIYNVFGNFYSGITLFQSFRAPSLEELYSEGPHLASFTFEIGNPDLGRENGLAKELFLRYRGQDFNLQLSGYHNHFSNYIFARDTGERNFRYPELNNFQFLETPATFYGVELSAEANITNRISVGGNSSFTIANREVDEDEQMVTGFTEDKRPLPRIPPFKGSVYADYKVGNFSLRFKTRFSAEQTRVGEFEDPTDGYQLFDASAQYSISSSSLLHTFSFQAQNITNEKHLNHLSRIKEIYPEPGRNFSLLYRVYF